MTETTTVLRRLKAYADGKPLPQGDTLPMAIARNPDILIVSFVRMGGETAPWGIAWMRLRRSSPSEWASGASAVS